MPTAPPTSKNPLMSKVGPLPMWGWLAVAAAGIFFYMKQGSSSSAQTAAGQQQQLPYPTYQDYGQYGGQPMVFMLPGAASSEQGTSSATSTGNAGATTPAPWAPYTAGSPNPHLAEAWGAGTIPSQTIPVYAGPGGSAGSPIVGTVGYGSPITPTGHIVEGNWPGSPGQIGFIPVAGGYVGAGDVTGNPSHN